jgi:RHS repeat-associated protein
VTNAPISGSRIYYLKNDDRTTGLVSTMRYSVEGKDTSSLKYTYDANGNIVQIKENGIFKARYAYDALNRLIREDNKALNKTYTMTYDAGGNISARSERTFTLDAEVFGNTETLYSYKGDQLVSVNDNDGFTYDALGNPTTYFGKALAWGKVRQLNSITSGSESIQFTYDASGIRTSKVSGNAESQYIYNNGRLEAEFRTDGATDKVLYFNYGINGISGFTLKDDNGETVGEYIYRKNAQGDVTHIFDEELNLVAKYEYDAWGNHTVTEYTTDNIGALNPIRYRGYYYDQETGLYYLKSRYYDPDTGRFINADNIGEMQHNAINGLNLYSYCLNSPTMMIDPMGNAPLPWWAKILIGVAVIAILAIAVVATAGIAGVGIGAAFSAGFAGAAIGVGASGLAVTIATGAFAGAVVGAGIGLAMGAVTGGIGASISGGDFWNGVLDGASTGFMMGAITGAVTGGVRGGIAFKNSTPIFRAVSQAEANGISKTGQFSLRNGAYEGKQFGLRLSETRAYANLEFNKNMYNSVVATRVPNSVLNQFAKTATDAFVFKSGVITVSGS